jgi:transporter family protein
LSAMVIIVGMLGGLVNGLGNWAVFASLERGAKASVAIPLTALYPLFTVILATAFLKERPTSLQWLGIALAVAGGAMLSYEPAVLPASRQEQIPCGR